MSNALLHTISVSRVRVAVPTLHRQEVQVKVRGGREGDGHRLLGETPQHGHHQGSMYVYFKLDRGDWPRDSCCRLLFKKNRLQSFRENGFLIKVTIFSKAGDNNP